MVTHTKFTKVPTLMPPFLLCDVNADKVHCVLLVPYGVYVCICKIMCTVYTYVSNCTILSINACQSFMYSLQFLHISLSLEALYAICIYSQNYIELMR